jgi:hypothetical protein
MSGGGSAFFAYAVLFARLRKQTAGTKRAHRLANALTVAHEKGVDSFPVFAGQYVAQGDFRLIR